MCFRSQLVKLAAKGDDHGRGTSTAEAGDAVAVKSGAVDDLLRGEIAGRCFYDRAAIVAANTVGPRARDDAAALSFDQLGQLTRDLAVIHHAGFGDVDAGDAAGLRFQLADPFGA